MWDFNLGEALGAMVKTAPYIVVRMLVYFGIALLYIIATGGGGAIGYGVTSFGDAEGAGAFYGALFGFAGASGFLYWAREYILYLVKAGHVAVLTLLYDDKPIPGGRGQIDHGIATVKDNFAQSSTLFAVDQLVKGVLKVITGTLNTIANIIPIPGLDRLTRIIGKIVSLSLTYVDEIILAYHFRSGRDNIWESSKTGLVLYAQNYVTMAKNAVWLYLFMWVITIILFILLLGPAFAIASIFPGDGGWYFIVAFLLAWSFKSALLEPVAIYALMQVFFKTIEGQSPSDEWESRLEQASDKFRELRDKASNWIGGKGQPADMK